MTTYTHDQLQEIIRLHGLWLNGEDGGKRADLSGANLRGADLIGADLTGANLRDANLIGAVLTDADLTGAYMIGSVLSNADLTGAVLCDTIGNGRQIKTVQTDEYTISYTTDRMQIGCENHAIDDWWGFDDHRIESMDYGALSWWRVWKPILKQIIENSPATPTLHEESK